MESNEEKKPVETQPKKWLEIAEVRMLLYVIPVGAVLALVGLLLSQLSGR
jgi:hypothetical protein